MNGALSEAYQRLRNTGPEWGADQLTNHGPMAAEVLVRRGRSDAVGRWVDRYVRRLDDLPGRVAAIADRSWMAALGDGRRITDWIVYFEHQLAETPWRGVLAIWWPRLLPGIASATTHGVIRVSHVVRALLQGGETEGSIAELARGLALWAARSAPLPVMAEPSGVLDSASAVELLPRIPIQAGNVAHRFGQLASLPGWPEAVAALRPATTPEDVRARLTDMVTAATLNYAGYGHASPILLVHTATAPNAVLHTLPALPEALWALSLSHVWAVTASILAAYAPATGSTPTEYDQVPSEAELLDRAIWHGDEHVIKFIDTAADVYSRTGNIGALAAGKHITTLIAPASS